MMHRGSIAFALSALWSATASAFCGFYVARADTKLYNQASQVVLVRDGKRTVLTMSNDYQGEPAEFAVVVPVPTFLEREQIHVAESALIEHLDAYTAPRLVEYFDEDPCAPRIEVMAMAAAEGGQSALPPRGPDALGVTIEAAYTVGEYDILILSAKQSTGLVTWLKQNDYRIPDGAEAIVGSYLEQGMRFFVAKVNLEEHSKNGRQKLRPIQIAFETPKFMLPIRLGTVNADGPQELFIYTLTRTGRVEITNYRTVRLPTQVEVPLYVKDEFGPFYRDMFRTAVARESGEAVFLEYAWDTGWCDPCAADSLTEKEFRELGVFWLDEQAPATQKELWPPGWMPRPPEVPDVFVTRLHVRYDADHFPEDLTFQETGDRSSFQGTYAIRHPWFGKSSCDALEDYYRALPARGETEAQTLARLTGWNIDEVRKRAGFTVIELKPAKASKPSGETEPWWKWLWE